VRFWQHNCGYEKTTRPYAPFTLIFSAAYETRQLARQAEKYYKSTVGKRQLRKIRANLES
jgi:putative endonuclease